MADELLTALRQVKAEVGKVLDVQSARLGQPMKALSAATADKPMAFIYLVSGVSDNGTYSASTDTHRIEIRFYWPLANDTMAEVVEEALARTWDRVMTKFFDDDGDRNLNDTVTLALIGGEDGNQPYTCGYEVIGEVLHRILIVPVGVTVDAHSA